MLSKIFLTLILEHDCLLFYCELFLSLMCSILTFNNRYLIWLFQCSYWSHVFNVMHLVFEYVFVHYSTIHHSACWLQKSISRITTVHRERYFYREKPVYQSSNCNSHVDTILVLVNFIKHKSPCSSKGQLQPLYTRQNKFIYFQMFQWHCVLLLTT